MAHILCLFGFDVGITAIFNDNGFPCRSLFNMAGQLLKRKLVWDIKMLGKRIELHIRYGRRLGHGTEAKMGDDIIDQLVNDVTGTQLACGQPFWAPR